MKQTQIILHIPHSSAYIPDEYRHQFILDDAWLDRELLRVTDHYTEELFTGLSNNPNKVVAQVSRLLVDVERFADDAQEPMASLGVGAVYQANSTGKMLRAEISNTDRHALLDRFYYPHHRRLTGRVAETIKRGGQCLIIDCHGFPSVPLSYDLDQSVPRPDICLETDPYHTPGYLVSKAKAYFESLGLTVGIDEPYSGALVPLDYYHSDNRVCSLMIEVNRQLYMDELTGVKSGCFERVQEILLCCILGFGD